MSNWLLRATNDWLKPIYERLHELLCAQSVLHADETTLQVLHELNRTPQKKSYMWLYRTSGNTEHPIVLYDYPTSRSGKHPKEFLKGFKGCQCRFKFARKRRLKFVGMRRREMRQIGVREPVQRGC